jgi:Ca2+-transporting ATPase
MADRALRVLAAAWRELDGTAGDLAGEEIERDLVFAGLAGMYDPPRPEVKDAVALCKSAGIRVVMITGDHPQTALVVARELVIATDGDEVVSGRDLEAMGDEELMRQARHIAVYARVTAAHKLRIVRALQKNGAVVAMTGDGVNDAPAIKGADIGVAMGRTGTEVTKEASDMVITDDNFAPDPRGRRRPSR